MNDTSNTQVPTPSAKQAMQISISWRALAIFLLMVIALMTYLWKPWTKPLPARTITIQGQATVTATPNVYEFQPIFEGTDIKALTVAGNDAVAQLKLLGVKDVDIKTTISSDSNVKPMPLGTTMLRPYPANTTSTYMIVATVTDKALAQKVSDYLASTTASGQITPTASFDKDTQAKLDLQARSKASADAKAKASVMAKQLGARVGSVVRISEGGYGIFPPEMSTDMGTAQSSKLSAGPTIQAGTNEVNYSFTVEFELK